MYSMTVFITFHFMLWHRLAHSFNPSNAEATFVLSTRTLKLLKTMPALSCWYSLDSYRRALSFEYPFALVSVIFSGFLHNFVLVKLATSSIRVKLILVISRKQSKRVSLSCTICPSRCHHVAGSNRPEGSTYQWVNRYSYTDISVFFSPLVATWNNYTALQRVRRTTFSRKIG